jgi:hypothetical protein
MMTTDERAARLQALLPTSRVAATAPARTAIQARALRAILVGTLAVFAAFFGLAVAADPPAADSSHSGATIIQYRSGPSVLQPQVRTRSS